MVCQGARPPFGIPHEGRTDCSFGHVMNYPSRAAVCTEHFGTHFRKDPLASKSKCQRVFGPDDLCSCKQWYRARPSAMLPRSGMNLEVRYTPQVCVPPVTKGLCSNRTPLSTRVH